jgi:hypothetical protein
MSIVPMDLERRFELRWARFSRSMEAAALQKNWLRGQSEPLVTLLKAKRKTRRTEAAGLRSAPAIELTAQKVVSACLAA